MEEIVAYLALGAAHIVIAVCLLLRQYNLLSRSWLLEVAMVAACASVYFVIAFSHLP
jgi:hypothetical protein